MLNEDFRPKYMQQSRHDDGKDLISRADAIDAVAEEWLSEASAESPYVNDYDINKYRELAEDLFNDIPSAEYSKPLQTTLNDDLVSKADVIDAVCRTRCGDKAKGCPAHSCLVIEEFDALPSAELVLQTPQTYGKSINPLNAEVVEDLISRADAKQQISEWATIITKPTLLDKDATMVVLDLLPSAEAVPQGRLIDADSLISDLEEWKENPNNDDSAVDLVNHFIGIIRATPSAYAVPQSEQYKKGFEDAKRAFLVEYARESKNMWKRNAQLEVMLNAQKAMSAEAVPGEWLYRWNDVECSVCGEFAKDKSNFCPNCGARMTSYKGGEDD